MDRARISITSAGMALLLVACGSTSPGGGSGGAGGAAGSGGASSPKASGGSGGGSSATGGMTSSGGATSNPAGGTPSAGGSQAQGGAPGQGGATSPAGGSGGSGGSNSGGTVTGGSTSSGAGGGSGAGGSGKGGSAAGGSGVDGGSAGTAGGVTVQLDQTHQTIDGFGINDTWGSSFSSSQADALFSTTGSGIGLTILRTGMNDSGSFYNSFESTNISAATSRGGKVIGSCWSPPAKCKSNNSVNDGGHLNTSCYDSWSTTIASFAKSNSLYAMSIGNEPDFASCGSTEPCNGNYPTTLYTANEMVAFVKVAGPKLQAAGIKVIAPEPSEWIHLWSNESASGSQPSNKNSSDPLKCGFPASSKCSDGSGYDYGHWLAKDATAWAAFDIIGVHEYDTQHAEPWPSDVTAARKPVWQTEMSGVKWWPEQGPSSDINNGVAVAGWIHSALVVGDASAWLWWWYSQSGDNEGLMLGSTDTKRHYTLGNYSKFVRPGYTRVEVAGNSNADVLLSAYKGGDGTVVVVAINKGSAAVTVPISIAGGTAPKTLTPNVTSSSDDLKAGSAVTVTNGSFTASLASMTVTTFVGK
jgi:glucuronoarabinoxylan endo-1,4-beta-xylanase